MPRGVSVSVVIPCRNHAQYLRAALVSVAAQTVVPSETIVVDDGSTDDTAAVASRAGATVLRQAGLGVNAARNAGLRHASGERVIFLDADDELEASAVGTGVDVLARHPDAWMVARFCQLIDELGRPLPTNVTVPASGDLYAEWLQRNLVWTPGAAMFRRAPLLALGGFPLEGGPASDYAVYLSLARLGRVVLDPRFAVRYRQHDTNMSRDPVHMLRAVLGVLDRERRHAPGAYARHFRPARRTWCTFYGEQIIQQLRSDARAGRVGAPQLAAAALLLRECRGLVVRHLGRKLTRVAGGHPPSPIEPGRFASAPALAGTQEPVEARR